MSSNQRVASRALSHLAALALALAATAALSPAWAAPWQESILHAFAYNDGASPRAGLSRSATGVLYGTTYNGGSGGWGTLFAYDGGRIDTLHAFSSTDGRNPAAAPILSPNGILYGTTPHGGDFSRSADGYGTVYSYASGAGFAILHTFTNGTDGGTPLSPLLRAADGTLYGTTYYGGTNFAGIAFSITPAGVLTTLHLFNDAVGYAPEGGLAQAPGTAPFYGTTAYYGAAGYGSVFGLLADGTFRTLYTFAGTPDGAMPEASLLVTNTGLVGTTAAGGATDAGSIFGISAAGSYKLLHSFSCATDGGAPTGNLIADAAGNLYGTASNCGMYGEGTVFRFDPRTGAFTVLHAFAGNTTDGGTPLGGLVLDPAGNLYGTTRDDGINGDGTIYELSPPSS
jgi:uncharacterized repeat protein (TIGR03803 family)